MIFRQISKEFQEMTLTFKYVSRKATRSLDSKKLSTLSSTLKRKKFVRCFYSIRKSLTVLHLLATRKSFKYEGFRKQLCLRLTLIVVRNMPDTGGVVIRNGTAVRDIYQLSLYSNTEAKHLE